MKKSQTVDMLALRRAIEASWQPDTAYHSAEETGNPALGQCYVTSRVVQHFFPEAELAEGEVTTPAGSEWHFWNVLTVGDQQIHLDLTWQQFPHGSLVKNWKIRLRDTYNDSQPTVERFERLLQRVQHHLDAANSQ